MNERAVLIIGGAPRIPVDAVRHMTVHASGRTAVTLAAGLPGAQLLLSVDAVPIPEAARYHDRAELDQAVQAWVSRHPDGVVVSSAAINDYQVDAVVTISGGSEQRFPLGAKVPSGAERMAIELVPAPKLIDQLAAWGHTGPLVAFKYQAAETVLAAAERLRLRTGAAVVLANSLCGSVQALVDSHGERHFDSRDAVVTALIERIRALASR